jgi:replication factor A1
MISYEEILDEILEKADISKEELEEKIKDKYRELSGLVSMQGAAHLVARDFGINILLKKRKLKVEDLKDGMKNIDVKGRITFISDPREFDRKDGSKGKVCNIFITDGSGSIRIPLWDKQVDSFMKNFEKGDVVDIKNGTVKLNNLGNLELRLSNFSRIEKTEDDSSIPTAPDAPRTISKRVEIENIGEGLHSVRGNIVHLFKINFTYKMCPECRSKLEDGICKEHGKVKPETNMIISAIVDDGTGSLRVVFFKEQASKISGLEPKTLVDLGQDDAYEMLKKSVLGKEVILSGRVQRNKLFENLEMIVNDVQETNPVQEGKGLIDEIKSLG